VGITTLQNSQYFSLPWHKYGGAVHTRSIIMAVALGLFFYFLFKQHAVVFNYNDDWGVAVLDYVVVIDGFQGQDFSLSQALAFVGGLYERWSGRNPRWTLRSIHQSVISRSCRSE